MTKLLITLTMVAIMVSAIDAGAQTADADTAQVLDNVTVYGAHRDFGTRSSQMSAIDISPALIRTVPTTFGETDVMKALQKFPGVQQVSDGSSGILIRGGNFDHNIIQLDGMPIYGTEHLSGFVSSINPDILRDVALYKGAFPSRYGGRIGGIVDVALRSGDMYKYHALASVGLLGARVQAEGPIIKGRTSFNVGARMSYLGLVIMPIYKKIAEDEMEVTPYINMKYYDISGKITHRLSSTDRLHLVMYYGKDLDEDTPEGYDYETKEYPTPPKYDENKKPIPIGIYEVEYKKSKEDAYRSLGSSLRWTRTAIDGVSSNISLTYSHYYRHLNYYEGWNNKKTRPAQNRNERDTVTVYRGKEYQQISTSIGDVSLNADFNKMIGERHDVRWGTQISTQHVVPNTEYGNNSFTSWSDVKGNKETVYDTMQRDSLLVLGKGGDMATLSLYAEDDWSVTERLKCNLGIRYSLYGVKGRTYNELEPRASLRWLLSDNFAVKASFAVMSQGVRQLRSTNLAKPYDIWVPLTKEIGPMRSVQEAAGISWSPSAKYEVSVEGYYKKMYNLLEYFEGASFYDCGEWERIVAMGKGRSYGIELLLHKKVGRTTGWISYTWSKSLRLFDRQGMSMNGGREYYDINDRRNNFNLVFTHRFSEHCDFSASWVYVTGRRGNLPQVYMDGSYPYIDDNQIKIKEIYMRSNIEKNGYRIPATHHLDISFNFRKKVGIFTHQLSLGIYNLYNRKNLDDVYITRNSEGPHYDEITVIKGICKFPLMPFLTYQLSI